jgi:hypothetical protein
MAWDITKWQREAREAGSAAGAVFGVATIQWWEGPIPTGVLVSIGVVFAAYGMVCVYRSRLAALRREQP